MEPTSVDKDELGNFFMGFGAKDQLAAIYEVTKLEMIKSAHKAQQYKVRGCYPTGTRRCCLMRSFCRKTNNVVV